MTRTPAATLLQLLCLLCLLCLASVSWTGCASPEHGGADADAGCPPDRFGAICEPWTECAPGTYVIAAGSEHGDRLCAGCVSGSFTTDANAARCSPWTDCRPGEYVRGAPSATADRVCAPCPEGTYSAGSNQDTCLSADACPAGTVETDSAAPTRDAECEPCPPGRHCPGGDAPATWCGDGADTWDDDADSSTPCVPRTVCAAGHFVTFDGDAASDRECTACDAGTYSSTPNSPSCVAASPCPAGTVQISPASSTSGPSCDLCAPGTHCPGGALAPASCGEGSGSWDHDGAPSTPCVPRTVCPAGTFVVDDGDATHDRQCAPCEDGTHSTGQNESTCAPSAPCPPGTVQVSPGTETSEPWCEPCVAGAYCPGGEAPAQSCGGVTESWDHDLDPATPCADHEVCAPGTRVRSLGDATHDRACEPCPVGTFSEDQNALRCTPFTECDAHGAVTEGDATNDRVCHAWLRQFGTAEEDAAAAFALDAAGHIYVLGSTQGAFPGETNAGGHDLFLRKMKIDDGRELWTRQFGTSGNDVARALAIDPFGDLLVVGDSTGAFPGETNAGSADVFVHKVDADGAEVWTRQFGTSSSDVGWAVAADADGDVYVAGSTHGELPAQTSAGSRDAFLRKYARDGTERWTRQLGTGGLDTIRAVSVAASGDVYVAGDTSGAFPTEVNAGGNDAFLRKYDLDGVELWTRQLGSPGSDGALALVSAADGAVFVAGQTSDALPDQTHVGDYDAFVRKYDAAGTEVWTTQLGTGDYDDASAMALDGLGDVYLGGGTQGAFSGHAQEGTGDAFYARLDGDGAEVWIRQLGTPHFESIRSIEAFGGHVYLLGYTRGVLPGQLGAGELDTFVMRALP